MTVHSNIGFVFLVCMLIGASKQSEGSSCVSDCTGYGDGDYHSCQGCNVYATCSNNILYDARPCPASLVWDDSLKRCEYTSETCPQDSSASIPDQIELATTFSIGASGVNWDDASESCRSNGLQLVTVDSAEKQASIEEFLDSEGGDAQYWIGLSDIETEGEWKWVSDEDVSFTNWDDTEDHDEPNNWSDGPSNGEDCIILRNGHQYKWNDLDCSYTDFADKNVAALCEDVPEEEIESTTPQPVVSTTPEPIVSTTTNEPATVEQVCIEHTKVIGSNILFTDGSNFASAQTKEECLDLCEEYDDCQSVEFNSGFKKCQINDRKLGEDEVKGQHSRWMYCHRNVIMN